MKSVGFTGHRQLASDEQASWAQAQLADACQRAASGGYEWFMSGGAPGGDWWFTDAALAVGTEDSMVAMALPFWGFLNYYRRQSSDYAEYIDGVILKKVRPLITVQAERKPSGRPDKVKLIHERNRWLVDNSDIIIGLYDGRKSGGTYATLKYARAKGRKILWINPGRETSEWIK